MTAVRELLNEKGPDIFSVKPDDTILEALEVMANKNVGAVLVLDDDGGLAGIMSERDYARKVVLKGKASRDTLVKEIMTSQVYCVYDYETVQQVMLLMTEKNFRHVPVLDENETLLGVISVGDVVRLLLNEQAAELSNLNTHIYGGYG